MGKPRTQVLTEYAAAGTVADWLVAELTDYFAGDVADPVEGRHLVNALVEGDYPARQELTESQVGPDETAVVFISLDGDGDGRRVRSAWRKVPTPISLMVTLALNAREDDVVTLTHVLGDGTPYVMSNVWPFGFDDAVLMCTPAPSRIADALRSEFEAGLLDFEPDR